MDGSINKSVVLLRQALPAFSGRKLEALLRGTTAAQRAALIAQIKLAERKLPGFDHLTTGQLCRLARVSVGYVSTARNLSPADRQLVAIGVLGLTQAHLFPRKKITDMDLAALVATTEGCARVWSALEQATAPVTDTVLVEAA